MLFFIHQSNSSFLFLAQAFPLSYIQVAVDYNSACSLELCSSQPVLNLGRWFLGIYIQDLIFNLDKLLFMRLSLALQLANVTFPPPPFDVSRLYDYYFHAFFRILKLLLNRTETRSGLQDTLINLLPSLLQSYYILLVTVLLLHSLQIAFTHIRSAGSDGRERQSYSYGGICAV